MQLHSSYFGSQPRVLSLGFGGLWPVNLLGSLTAIHAVTSCQSARGSRSSSKFCTHYSSVICWRYKPSTSTPTHPSSSLLNSSPFHSLVLIPSTTPSLLHTSCLLFSLLHSTCVPSSSSLPSLLLRSPPPSTSTTSTPTLSLALSRASLSATPVFLSTTALVSLPLAVSSLSFAYSMSSLHTPFPHNHIY